MLYLVDVLFRGSRIVSLMVPAHCQSEVHTVCIKRLKKNGFIAQETRDEEIDIEILRRYSGPM